MSKSLGSLTALKFSTGFEGFDGDGRSGSRKVLFTRSLKLSDILAIKTYPNRNLGALEPLKCAKARGYTVRNLVAEAMMFARIEE